MLAKWKLELISFLSSLTLISVGFSSWNISSSVPVIETVDGTVQADYVIKTDEYVYFADGGITLPEYNEKGFIVANKDADGGFSASDKAKIQLVFTVDYNKCLGLNGESSALIANGDTYLNIECTITLKNNATTFFAENTIGNPSLNFDLPSTDENNLFYSTVTDENNKTVAYTLNIKNYPYTELTKNGEISLTLTLTSINQTNINNLLTGNTFIFDTEVYGHK